MHFTGMAAAKFVISEEGLSYTTSNTKVKLLNSSDSVLGAVISSMIFLWILMFLTVADLRAWFYNHTRTLREIELLMNEFEKDQSQTHASRNLSIRYRSIPGVKNMNDMDSSGVGSDRECSSRKSFSNFLSFCETLPKSLPGSMKMYECLASSMLLNRPTVKIIPGIGSMSLEDRSGLDSMVSNSDLGILLQSASSLNSVSQLQFGALDGIISGDVEAGHKWDLNDGLGGVASGFVTGGFVTKPALGPIIFNKGRRSDDSNTELL